jgi:hypothetical protein
MADIITELFLNEEERKAKCLNEIQLILRKYNCQMSPVFMINAQGIKGDVQILANAAIMPPK